MIWIIFQLGCMFWVGWNITLFFKDGRIGLLERAALAYALGAGVVTFAGFLLGAAGVTLNPSSLGAAYLGISLVLFIVNRKRLGMAETGHPRSRRHPVALVLFIILALVIVFSGIINMYWPAHYPDSIGSWLAKGKAIAATGSLSAVRFGSHPQYPLHVPLSTALMFLHSEAMAKIPFTLNYICLIIIFFTYLRRTLSAVSALLFTLLMATLPYLFEQSYRACADLTCALYYVSGTLYLCLFFREGKKSWLILSGLLCGLSVWTKSEGWFLTGADVIVLFVYLLRKKRVGLLIYFILPTLILGGSWSVYSSVMLGYSNRFFGNFKDSSEGIIQCRLSWWKLESVLRYIWQKFLEKEAWGGLGPLFLIVLLLCWKSLKKFGYLLAIIMLNFIILVFVFYSIPKDLQKMMHQTIKREYVHFFPLLVFYIALSVGPVLDAVLNISRKS
ncbi:MAG: glycosyltransferase family 39 protein [PVC group bacterium]